MYHDELPRNGSQQQWPAVADRSNRRPTQPGGVSQAPFLIILNYFLTGTIICRLSTRIKDASTAIRRSPGYISISLDLEMG